MALERMCWCNGSKDGVDDDEGKKGLGCNFYDEMKMTLEDWHLFLFFF